MEEIKEKLFSKGQQFSEHNIWEFIKLEVRNTNRSLESYKKIREFAIRQEEFPKTTTRKIKRFLFKDFELKPEVKNN